MVKKVVHSCEIAFDKSGYGRQAPNGHLFAKISAFYHSYTTVDINLTRCKKFFRNKTEMVLERKRHLKHYPCVIHPFSKFNVIREILFILVWSQSLFFSLIFTAFRDLFMLEKATQTYGWMSLYYICYMMGVTPLALILAILFFFTGYVEHGTIVLELKKIMLKYLYTYFIFDLGVVVDCFGSAVYEGSTTMPVPLGLMAYARLGTLRTYFKRFVEDKNINKEHWKIFMVVIETVLFANMFTCMFYFTSNYLYRDLEEWPTYAWGRSMGIDPQSNTTVYDAYLRCLLLILCHFFGAGTGFFKINDVPSEQLMLSIVMVFGRLWTLFILANTLRLFSVINVSDTKYEEYLNQLKAYMKQKGLPDNLQEKMVEYYQYRYQNQFFDEDKILATLSKYIRQEIMMWQARKLVSGAKLFKVFPKSLIGEIVGECISQIYLSGDILVNFSEKFHFVYFLASGTIAAITDRGMEVAHLEDGDEIGLISLVEEEPESTFTYLVVESSEIYRIHSKVLKDLLKDRRDILHFFSVMVEERIKKFNDIEKKALTGKHDDLLGQLSSGKILEHPRKRHVHVEDY